jgi:hemolysin activation/secretion protein
VKDFKFDNVPFLAESEIQEALTPFKGRNLTMAQIDEARAKISDLYRQRGYPVAQAYAPPQNAKDGVIEMRILVGVYGNIGVENSSLAKDWYIGKVVASPFRAGQPIRQSDLERAILLAYDQPGVGLPEVHIGPGQTPGSTDFLFQTPKTNRLEGFLLTDNSGSRYTGRWRIMAKADVNSPFGLGDKLSIFGLTTSTGELKSVSLNYAFPLAANGLRLDLGFSHVYYKLGEEFEDLNAKGTSNIFQGTLSYPLIRSSSQNLYVNLSLAYKDMEDKYQAFDVVEPSKSVVGKLNLTYERWGRLASLPLFTRIGWGLTYGRINFKTEEQREMDNRRVEGDFSYFSLDFTTNLALSPNWSWSFTATGQKALNRNLDSSEQFSVTGAYGVRVYRESITGDNGYLLNTEFRYRLPQIGSVDHYLGVFADLGAWSLLNKPYPTNSSDSLADVGLGYYFNFKNFAIKAQVARAIGDYPLEIKKESETVFSVAASFVF